MKKGKLPSKREKILFQRTTNFERQSRPEFYRIQGFVTVHTPLQNTVQLTSPTWMSQEVTKWLVTGLFHLLINGRYWGYNHNQLTNHLKFTNFLGHPSNPVSVWPAPPGMSLKAVQLYQTCVIDVSSGSKSTRDLGRSRRGSSRIGPQRLAVICHARHALEPADEAGLGKAHRQGVYTLPSQDGPLQSLLDGGIHIYI